jgi:S1-C subfamily serine protease
MDERNDEKPEPAKPVDPLPSWTEPATSDAMSATSDAMSAEPPDGISDPPFRSPWWGIIENEAPIVNPLGSYDAGSNPSGSYTPESGLSSDHEAASYRSAYAGHIPAGPDSHEAGAYAAGAFGPESHETGAYAAGRYGSGTYPPGGYTPGDYAAGRYGSGTYPPGGYTPGDYAATGYGPGGYGPAGIPPAGPPAPKRGRKAVALLAAALVLIGVGSGAGIAYLSRSSQGSAAGLTTSPAGHSLTTAQIAAAVDPAVVDIVTNLGEGTGMIATANGEIITNNHVVEGASSIKVSIDNGGTYTARVVGTDATADVAVLQLMGVSGLPTVKFGNSSSLVIGSAVVAIGNAGGQGFPSTVTAGDVTSLARTIMASNDSGGTETLTGMIQMDALIEPGNSGGPLVESSGEVVGMDTAALSADGATPIGFALPINRVVQIANDIEHGKAGKGVVIGVVAFLGVEGEAVSVGTGTTTGVGLEYVDPGSPADIAGLQEGDIITAFDGHATPTLNDLATLIHKLRPGDRVRVTFDSFTGATQTVTATLAAASPT